MRLIRSKGVGVYFVTQNPLDVPDTVLAQLGNRVQHALRAFTPRDQKAVQGGGRDVPRQSQARHRARSITELGKGEALVSFLEGKGTPSMVERALIRPPSARVGADHAGRAQGDHRRRARCKGKYDTDGRLANRPTRCCRSARKVAAPPPAGRPPSARRAGGKRRQAPASAACSAACSARSWAASSAPVARAARGSRRPHDRHRAGHERRVTAARSGGRRSARRSCAAVGGSLSESAAGARSLRGIHRGWPCASCRHSCRSAQSAP